MRALRFAGPRGGHRRPRAGMEARAGGRRGPQPRCSGTWRCGASSTGRSDSASVPVEWVNMMPSTVISQFMKEFDFHGPAMSVSAMCASGNAGADHGQVVARLRYRLRRHPAGHRLCPACPRTSAGSATSAWPSSTGRRSTAVVPSRRAAGDSSGARPPSAMVLSRKPTGSYASVLGGAMTMDASSLVAMAPDLDELFRCFREAMADAGARSRRGRLHQRPRAGDGPVRRRRGQASSTRCSPTQRGSSR